jgi:hypothetical protein
MISPGWLTVKEKSDDERVSRIKSEGITSELLVSRQNEGGVYLKPESIGLYTPTIGSRLETDSLQTKAARAELRRRVYRKYPISAKDLNEGF